MTDEPNPVHQMEITAETETGWEIWTCPDCGRKLMIQWEPFTKLTIFDGDEYAMHAGGKGGLTVGSMEVRQ